MVSAANAGFTLDGIATGVGSLAIDGTLEASATEVFYVLIVSNGTVSPLDDTALGTAAPSMAGYAADSDSWVGVIPFTSGYTGGAWVLANAPGEAFKTGTYIEVTFSSTSSLFIEGWWYEEGSDTYGLFFYIPEPMTIALLGLGGLLVRRRRR